MKRHPNGVVIRLDRPSLTVRPNCFPIRRPFNDSMVGRRPMALELGTCVIADSDPRTRSILRHPEDDIFYIIEGTMSVLVGA